MKPRYWVLLAVGLAAAILPIAAEVAYRKFLQDQLATLHDEVRRDHPEWPSTGMDFWRLGYPSPRFEPSLFRDLKAWTTDRLGWGTELHDDFIRNSYHCVWIYSGSEEGSHAFLWSPRHLRFVSYWQGHRCGQSACPWWKVS